MNYKLKVALGIGLTLAIGYLLMTTKTTMISPSLKIGILAGIFVTNFFTSVSGKLTSASAAIVMFACAGLSAYLAKSYAPAAIFAFASIAMLLIARNAMFTESNRQVSV